MRTANFRNKRRSGFTVIELMLTLVVAAVILGLGVPSFQGLMERNQLTSSINQFISSLAFTRSEAIKRNQRVLLCASNDGADCADTGYENGWIIFVDNDASGDRNGNEEILWVSEPLPGGLTLRGNNSCCATSVPYLASGRISGISGSVFLCKDDDVNKSKQITITTSGKVRLVDGTATECAT